MFTTKFYLRFLKIFLPIFVLTLPLANRDIFSVILNRIFPTRLVLVGLIMSSAAVFFFYRQDWQSKKNLALNWLKSDQLFKLLILLLIIRIISLKNSLNYSASFDLTLFYLSIISLYLVLKFLNFHEKKFMDKLWRLHLLTVSLIVLYGFLQLCLSFFGIRLPGVLVGSTFVRIPATFYDANHLPAYLITAFPSIFIGFFYVKKNYQKMLALFLLSLFALVLLFTFSRSGFLSFVVSFLILATVFIIRGYWRKALTIFVVFIFALVVIFLTSQTQLSIFTRLSSVLNFEDKSTVAHGLLAYGSLELLKKSPVIGLGYGSFSEHFRKSSIGKEHAFFDTATQVRIPAHSIWLEVLVETGLLGFSVYLWVIITIVEESLRALKKIIEKRMYLSQLALFASLIGILTSGLFYSYNLEFFWFFLFLVYLKSRNIIQSPVLGVDSQVLPGRDQENIPWKFFIQISVVAVMAAVLLFYKIGTPALLSGDEGKVAKIGWDMRRDWGYAVKNWWIPNFNGTVIADPPLPFWLNAFWTFLFDLGSWVPRFLPAFFAWLGILLVYIFYRFLKGDRFAQIAVFLLLAFPLFLAGVRFGLVYGYLFFFSSSLICLLSQFNRERKFLILPLILMFTFISLISYFAYIVSLCLTLVYLNWRSKKSQEHQFTGLSPLLFFSAIPAILWFVLVLSQYSGVIRSAIFLPSSAGDLFWTLLFLALPPLIYLLADIFNRFLKRGWIWLTIFLMSFSFLFSLNPTTDSSLSQLVQKRTEINRDGRIPLYILTPATADLIYYSQVPLFQVSPDELNNKFKTDGYFYAVLDGDYLRKLREDGLGGFGSLEVRGNLVLIERPGKFE